MSDSRVELVEKLRAASESILIDLRRAGVSLPSVASRIASKEDYEKALPIFVRHLKLDYPVQLLEAIARNMASYKSNAYLDQVVDVFLHTKHKSTPFHFSLALVISSWVSNEDVDKLFALIRNESLGEGRLGLLGALKRNIKKKSVINFLGDIRGNPQFSKELDDWGGL